jgi:methionyl-tRNA formyltransferase
VDVSLVAISAIPGEADATPGVITPQMTVGTSKGLLDIHSIQPAGKRAMAWQEFVNGRHVQPGDRFESIER